MSQAARDLAWVVNSPGFVHGANVAPHMPLLTADIDDEHLDAHLALGERHRVGRYFEQLLNYWLVHIRGVEMIAAGLQIRDGKRTVGEVDFLYRDEQGDVVHCEASVKFFLHHRDHQPSQFPGPNASDNYERKIAKLFDQQLTIEAPEIGTVDHRHAFVKGMMFYRPGDTEPVARPERLPADHLRGIWIRASEVDQLAHLSPDAAHHNAAHHNAAHRNAAHRNAAQPGERVCAIADKPHWLGTVAAERCESLATTRTRLATHFEGRAHPLMLSLRSASTPEVELDRLFVVSETWPG